MSDNSSKNKRIAKNTLFLYIRMAFVLIVSLYTTRVVLNVLGVEDYGIYNVVSGFVSMFAFLNTTMSSGIQRFYNYSIGQEDGSSVNQVYNTALVIQLSLSIFLLIALETIGIWYLNNKMVIPTERARAAGWIFQFSSISLMFVLLQIPYSAAIMAHEKMDYYALVSIFDVLAKLGMAFAIPYVKGDKLIWYGLFFLLVSVIDFFLYYVYAKKQFPEIKFNVCRDKNLFISMLSFSGWNVFGTFAYMFKNQGLGVVLNSFFGPIVNAANGIATMISNAIQGFQTNIVVAFRPQLVQSYAEKHYNRVINLFFSLSKVSYILLFIITVPVILEVELILKLWLNNVVPDYTVQFTVLMLISLVISSLHTPLTQIIHATGKMKNFQIALGITISSIVPLSWVLLRYGCSPISVYWVTIGVTILNQIISLYITRSVFPFSIKQYVKVVILPCIIATILIPQIPFIIIVFFKESFLRLLAVIFSTLIDAIVVVYFLCLNNYEKALINKYLERFLYKKNG